MSPLSDAQIAALSPAERRQLIQRLARPLSELVPAAEAHRIGFDLLLLGLLTAFATGTLLVCMPGST